MSATITRNPIRLWPKSKMSIEKDFRKILYVGRIEFRKGIQVLLAALDQLSEKDGPVTLRVIGAIHPPTRDLDDYCQKDFLTHINHSKMQERNSNSLSSNPVKYSIEYHGPCNHSDMAQHYDWAGMLIIPSLMENYPYVALEGLSRGCFIIGSDIGGIPEIVDRPDRGMLFDVENSTHLAEKIRECMQNAEEISGKMPRVAKEIESEFDLETCYLRLINDYTESPIQREKE